MGKDIQQIKENVSVEECCKAAFDLALNVQEFRDLVSCALERNRARINIASDISIPCAHWNWNSKTIGINLNENNSTRKIISSIVFEFSNACRSEYFAHVQAQFEATALNERLNGKTRKQKAKLLNGDNFMGSSSSSSSSKISYGGSEETPEKKFEGVFLDTYKLASRAYLVLEYASTKDAAHVEKAIATYLEANNQSASENDPLKRHEELASMDWKEFWMKKGSVHSKNYEKKFSEMYERLKEKRSALRRQEEEAARRQHYTDFVTTQSSKLDTEFPLWREKLGFPFGALQGNAIQWYPALKYLESNRSYYTSGLNDQKKCEEFRKLSSVPKNLRIC